MADYTVLITDIPDHKRGDRWVGIHAIGPVLINDAQPANELTRVRMFFRKGQSVYKLDSDETTNPNAPIVISAPVTWEVTIPEIDDFLPSAGVWEWDMEFFEEGKESPLTLYKGTITVVTDTTY